MLLIIILYYDLSNVLFRYYAKNCSASFPGIPVQSNDGTGVKYDSTSSFCQQIYYAGDIDTLSGWGYGRQQVMGVLITTYMGDRCLITMKPYRN